MRNSSFSLVLFACLFCVAYVLVKHVVFIVQSDFEELVHNQGTERDKKGMASLVRQPRTNIEDVARLMEMRKAMLAYHALSLQLGPKENQDCGAQNHRIVIRGRQYGQFSNILISLTHGLGFAEALNSHYRARGEQTRYSLVLPNYMLRALHPFDLTLLYSQYCFYSEKLPTIREKAEQMPSFTLSTLLSTKKSLSNIFCKLVEALWSTFDYASKSIEVDIDVVREMIAHDGILEPSEEQDGRSRKEGSEDDVEISSKMLFFWGTEAAVTWRKQSFPFLFSSAADDDEVAYYTRTYVVLLSALYSSAAPSVVNGALALAKSIVDETKSSDFGYSTAHRRDLDGKCGSIMKAKSTWEKDFGFAGEGAGEKAEAGASMRSCPRGGGQRAHECVSLDGAHPLCTMPQYFVHRLNSMVGLARLPIYLSSDSAGSDRYVESEGFIMGYMEKERLGLSKALSEVEQSCVDIMVCALGSGIFVGNPASTFTFQIQTLRTLLQRNSLPEARHHDIYFERSDDQKKPSWISQSSIRSMINSI